MATYSGEIVGDGEYFHELGIDEWSIYGSSRVGVERGTQKEIEVVDVSAEGEYVFISYTGSIDPPGMSSTYFERTFGDKRFELTNHLGNVLVTVNDRKLILDTTSNGLTNYYLADVMSYNDYYPFGMQMPGRNFSSSEYHHGFNGMEKDDDIAGNGNSYTATYWQYDSRLGRRWNIDPVEKPYLSSYCTFGNNPIIYVDPRGDDHYFNQAGEYIGSDGQGDELRFINTSMVKETFDFVLKERGANWLKVNSMIICFDEEQIRKAAEQIYREAQKNQEEGGGLLVIDPETAIVTLVVKPNTLGNASKEESREDHYSYGENVTAIGIQRGSRKPYEVILEEGYDASAGFSHTMVEYLVVGEFHSHQGTENNSSNMFTTGSIYNSKEVLYHSSKPDQLKALNSNHSVFSLDSNGLNYSHPDGESGRTNKKNIGKMAEQALRSKIEGTDENK